MIGHAMPTLWVVALAATALWTTLFSLASAPGVRGWRNLGLLASYLGGVAMFVALPLLAAALIWAAFGLAGGAIYYAHEWFLYLRTRAATDDAPLTVPRPTDPPKRPAAMAILHGLFLWPLMIPEAIEYLLADVGLLPPPPEPTPPTP
jgi:hypothetical protein